MILSNGESSYFTKVLIKIQTILRKNDIVKNQKSIDKIVEFLLLLNEKSVTQSIIVSQNNIRSLGMDINEVRLHLDLLSTIGYIEIQQNLSSIQFDNLYPIIKVKLLKPCFEHFENKKSKKQRYGIIAKITPFIAVIVTITTIFSNITNAQLNIQNKKENENPTYNYDTYFDWKKMDEVYNLLTPKSKINVYSKKFYQKDYYYDGACLVALFSNKADVDRNIVKFTVCADNIVEDLSPCLTCLASGYNGNPITVKIKNKGWGETGKVYLTIKSFFDNNKMQETESIESDIAVITLRDNVKKEWEFSSILPGEICNMSFASKDIFDVVWKDYSQSKLDFDIIVESYAPETDYRITFDLYMVATPNNVEVGIFNGDIDDNDYGIVIDTSLSTYAETYDVYQQLPAGQVVRIPIFVFPTKSCSMSLRITFEMDDGEVVEVPLLDNADFIIPYYDNIKSHVLDDTIDWYNLPLNTNIYFPFKTTDTILPSEVIPQ